MAGVVRKILRGMFWIVGVLALIPAFYLLKDSMIFGAIAILGALLGVLIIGAVRGGKYLF